MNKSLNFEVFCFGKYYSDLTTDSQFNRIQNLSEKGVGINLPEFNQMLVRNKLNLKVKQLQKVVSDIVQNGVASVDTKEDGYDWQWVIILKKFSSF